MHELPTTASEAAKKDREVAKFFDFSPVGGAEPGPDLEETVCRLPYVVATSRKLTHSRNSRTSKAMPLTGTNPGTTKTWSLFESILRHGFPTMTNALNWQPHHPRWRQIKDFSSPPLLNNFRMP